MLYGHYYGENSHVDTWELSSANTWIAQSIAPWGVEPDQAYALSSIKIRVNRSVGGTVGTLTLGLQLHDPITGKPTGTDLVTTTLEGSMLPAGVDTWATFAISFAVPNESDGTYMWVLRGVFSGGATLGIKSGTTSDYFFAQYATSANAGSTWTVSPGTILMQLWGPEIPSNTFIFGHGQSNELDVYGGIVRKGYYNNKILTLDECFIISTSQYSCNGVAILQTADRFFIASGTIITAYNLFTFEIDTAWGTSGVYNHAIQIYNIAINSSGQIAIAHAQTSNKIVSLLNAAGTALVWQVQPNLSRVLLYAWMVSFSGDGSVLCGTWDNSGGTFDTAYRLALADGAMVASYGTMNSPTKACRNVISDADGSNIYLVRDTTYATDAVIEKYPKASSTPTWSVGVGTRYSHKLLWVGSTLIQLCGGYSGPAYARLIDITDGSTLDQTELTNVYGSYASFGIRITDDRFLASQPTGGYYDILDTTIAPPE